MSSSLEPRYKRILELIAAGLTSREIAQRTGLSRQSVDTYVKELKRQLAGEPEAGGRLPSRIVLATIYQRLNGNNRHAVEQVDALPTADQTLDWLLTSFRLHAINTANVLWQGTPKVALQMATSVSQELESVIRQSPARSEYRHELLDVLMHLLVHQGRAYSQLASFDVNWCFSTGFDQTLHRIAREYSRKELVSVAGFFLGDAYIITGDHRQAMSAVQTALETAYGLDHDLVREVRCLGLVIAAKIWGLRAYRQEQKGVDSLAEQREFWAVASQIEEALDAQCLPRPSDRAFVYGSLARATAPLRLPVAQDYLDKARVYIALSHETGQAAPIRDVQLIDDVFFVRKALDPGSTLADLEEMAAQGIEQAALIGCTRLVIRLQGWLS